MESNSLSEILRQVQNDPKLSFWRAPHLPRIPEQTTAALQRVQSRFANTLPSEPPHIELETLYQKVSRHWFEYTDFSFLLRREKRQLPWLLFYPPNKPKQWLSLRQGYIQRFLQWLQTEGQSSAYRATLQQWIQHYPIQQSLLLDEFLPAFRKLFLTSSFSLLATWQELCKTFSYLQPQGASAFFQSWYSSEVEPHPAPTEFLEQAKLTGILAESNFLLQACHAALHGLKQRLTQRHPDKRAIQKLLSFLEHQEGSLRFAVALRPSVSESLLSPFHNRKDRYHYPDPSLPRDFLLKHLGHPEVNRPYWLGVKEHLRQIMLSWLVRLALEQFFKVIDRTADHEQWKYRKAFWKAYLEKGWISDAWVILGKDARQHTSLLLSEQSFYGKLTGGGGSRTQSVLLMKIGGVTIAEWSHSGSCRCWFYRHSSPPVLHQAEYHRDEVVYGADFEQGHHGKESGRWQGKVAECIAEQTRLVLRPHEYMP